MVVSLVDEINVVSEELVMVVGIPSVAVVNEGVAGHGVVARAAVSPSVEATAAHSSHSSSSEIDAHTN